MPEEFKSVDATIVVIFLIVSFGFGLLASKFLRGSSEGEEGYFLAGRKMPGWLTGISTAVTSMNADVAPAYCGAAIAVGLPICWFYMSRFGLALMIMAVLFAMFWRRLRVSTAPEFYAVRFGGRGSGFVRTYTSLFSVFIGMVPWIGAGILGVHKIFGPVFGFDAKSTTLIVILPVMLVYVWISGYAGVLVTDVIQSLIIIAANFVVALLVLNHFGGPTGLTEAIRGTEGLPADAILSSLPVRGNEVMGPLMVLLWFVITTIGAGGGQSTEGQRIFSCKNEREAAKVFVWSEAVLFLMLLLLTLPALGLLPDHPELFTAEPSVREEAYGMLLGKFLPTGFLGFALAALTASVMSTIDSHLNYGAQTLTNDVWRPGRGLFAKMPRAKGMLILAGVGTLIVGLAWLFTVTKTELFGKSALWHIAFVVAWPLVVIALQALFFGTRDDQALLVGRIFTLIIMLASIAIVYNSDSLFGIAVRLGGIFAAAATFGWAQWWWWRVNFLSWVAAVVGGPIIYFGLGPVLALIPGWVEKMNEGGTSAQYLGMVQAFVGMVVSTALWVTVALLTKPEKMENLKDFYRQARPLGWWKPVRDAVLLEDGEEHVAHYPRGVIAGGFATGVLGTSWICLGILALSQLYVGRYAEGIGCGIASLVLALIFRKAFAWHYNRLEM
ncbi:MAG: solute:Na+ symporter, family [Candidatus Sumerlaeota bacterium]|nr:solute:Na+ symporter, family [Candidatus Sumerlaeota bacterium]